MRLVKNYNPINIFLNVIKRLKINPEGQNKK